MIDRYRRGVALALATGVTLLWAAGARAQDPPAPSTLLPLEELWATVLSASPATPPVHDAGRIFIALRDGQVTAVDLESGVVVWEVEQLGVGYLAVGESDPSVEGLGGELLYLASRDTLQGLEKATGRVRWSTQLDAPLSAPLVWNNGWLIAALDTQTLLGLRAETGETIWQQPMDGGIPVGPSLAADRLYVSLDSGHVVALSLMTGTTIWEQHLGGTPNRILPLDDLFVGATDNYFYRLSRLTGAIKWRVQTGGDIVGLPAVDEDRVFFSSLDNMLYALSRKSGVQQWRKPLVARPTAGPRHTGDLLVVGGMSQDLSFFDPVTGVPFGAIAAPAELAFPPLHLFTAAGQLLLTITGNGRLRALGQATGPVLLELATTAILREDSVRATTVNTVGEGGVVDAGDTSAPTTAPSTAAAGEPSVTGEYAIQVSAFAISAYATQLADRLIERGYPAYVVMPREGDVPALHRVRIGDYPDRSAAQVVGQQVADAEDLDWYVVVLP